MTILSKIRILVTDCEQLAGLAVVRELGRAGFTVFAVGCDAWPAACGSGYVHSYERVVDPWLHPSRFLAEVLGCVRHWNIDAVLPVGEASLVTLLRAKQEKERMGQLICANEKGLALGLDKIKAYEQARVCGVPVVDGQVVEPHDPLPFHCFSDDALIARTSNRWCTSGIYQKGKSWILNNPSELSALHAELECSGERYLLQKCRPGRGEGAFFLINNGEVKLWHSHVRLAEIPWWGGVSARRKLTFDEQLKEWGERLLRSVQFDGIAMVEFRRFQELAEIGAQPKSEQACLVEVNARPWGSMALALHARIPFVSQWVKLQMGVPSKSRRIQAHCAAKQISQPGKKQLVCTSFYPGEVRHLSSVVKSYLSGRIEKHRALSFIKRSLKVLLSPKTHFDFFVVDDPRPCFVQWANVVVLSASGFFRRAIALFSRNLSLLFRIDALMLSSSRRALARTTGKRILVVCTGNRCRSPFVEQLLKADMAQSSIQVCSAGLKVQESNIPERFIGVFRRFGLNPRSHVAHAVCDSDIENADLIVLMERSHWWQIFFKFGFPAVRKSILLTAIDANEYNLKIEIPDPYLQSPWDAEHTFAWLHSLVQKLSTQIQEIHRLVDYEF